MTLGKSDLQIDGKGQNVMAKVSAEAKELSSIQWKNKGKTILTPGKSDLQIDGKRAECDGKSFCWSQGTFINTRQMMAHFSKIDWFSFAYYLNFIKFAAKCERAIHARQDVVFVNHLRIDISH